MRGGKREPLVGRTHLLSIYILYYILIHPRKSNYRVSYKFAPFDFPPLTVIQHSQTHHQYVNNNFVRQQQKLLFHLICLHSIQCSQTQSINYIKYLTKVTCFHLCTSLDCSGVYVYTHTYTLAHTSQFTHKRTHGLHSRTFPASLRCWSFGTTVYLDWLLWFVKIDPSIFLHIHF